MEALREFIAAKVRSVASTATQSPVASPLQPQACAHGRNGESFGNQILGNHLNASNSVPSDDRDPAIKKPKQHPAKFKWDIGKLRVWLESFRNYAFSFGVIPALANRVELIIFDPYSAFKSLRKPNISRTLFESAVTASFSLIEASKDPDFLSIVQQEGRSYAACLKFMETYAPNFFASQSGLL